MGVFARTRRTHARAVKELPHAKKLTSTDAPHFLGVILRGQTATGMCSK